LKEINKDCTSQNADTCWEGVATNLGLDTQKIKDCQTNEALNLLEQESALNNKYGITGSPQLLINDVEYSGDRTSEAYKNAICAAFKTKPAECQQTLSDTTSQTGDGGCQ
jgi:predicted DsbA family dithiol-disulfide isomerase